MTDEWTAPQAERRRLRRKVAFYALWMMGMHTAGGGPLRLEPDGSALRGHAGVEGALRGHGALQLVPDGSGLRGHVLEWVCDVC